MDFYEALQQLPKREAAKTIADYIEQTFNPGAIAIIEIYEAFQLLPSPEAAKIITNHLQKTRNYL